MRLIGRTFCLRRHCKRKPARKEEGVVWLSRMSERTVEVASKMMDREYGIYRTAIGALKKIVTRDSLYSI